MSDGFTTALGILGDLRSCILHVQKKTEMPSAMLAKFLITLSAELQVLSKEEYEDALKGIFKAYPPPSDFDTNDSGDEHVEH
jgi:hypothetical protein